jgi:hypothetical protein
MFVATEKASGLKFCIEDPQLHEVPTSHREVGTKLDYLGLLRRCAGIWLDAT